jgi:hypothetical protein
MIIEHIFRHSGASFTPGSGLVHLWVSGVGAQRLRSAWDACFVKAGLAEPLRLRTGKTGAAIHGFAAAYPFLPIEVIAEALESAVHARRASADTLDALATHALDARAYRDSYGLYAKVARHWGWVVQPIRLGFYPSLLLGAGRHARLLTMNIGEGVSAPLGLAGVNKAVGRDFLAAHGLPVAPGFLVGSVSRAVRRAREIGFAVVLKRLVGGNSDGVLAGLRTEAAVRSGATRLLRKDSAILVERFVSGTEVRLHFVAGRLHRAFHAKPREVIGDGRRSLAALIAARHPRYWRAMSSSTVHQGRLVNCLWTHGVRTFGDLRKVVPARKAAIRVSAATGSGMTIVDPATYFRRADIERLERFLERYGSPSCGMDVVVSRPRAPLDEGAVILELNAPCGFGYLDDPLRVAGFELQQAVRGDRAFQKSDGRVPVWLVLEEQVRDATLWRRVRDAFRRRHPRGVTRAVRGTGANWPGLLNQRDAEALLIRLSAAAILEHGLPANLAPRLVFEGREATFRRAFPIACRTARHAAGRLVAMPATAPAIRKPRSRRSTAVR